MQAKLVYFKLMAVMVFILQTFIQNTYANSGDPVPIFKLSGIGIVKDFIHTEHYSDSINEITIIDSNDGFDFVSFLKENGNEYQVAERILLNGSVVSHVVLQHPETSNSLVAVVTNSGQLLIIDVITKQLLFSELISQEPLLSLTTWYGSKLFISSLNTLYEVSILPSITIVSHGDIGGHMISGSFTKANSTQLLFANGDIYEEENDKITRVFNVSPGLFTDMQFVHAQDLNNDDLDEVVVTEQRVVELETIRKFDIIEVKSESKLKSYSGKRFISPVVAGDNAFVATWTESKTGPLRHQYSPSYCINPVQLSSSTPLCREFSRSNQAYYIQHIVIHYGDVNFDGTLDLVGRTEFEDNFVHKSIDAEDLIKIQMPIHDNRCQNSYLNSVIKYTATQVGLTCYGKYSVESAMSGGLRDIEQKTVIELSQGQTLTKQDFGSGTYELNKRFDHRVDIDLDGKQEDIEFFNVELNEYRLQISRLYDNDSKEVLITKSLPVDVNNPLKKFAYERAIDNHLKHGMYIQFKESTLYYEYGEDFIELGNGAYVDLSTAAYFEETGVYALTNAGELKVINVSIDPIVIARFCDNDTAVGLEKSGLNKLIYSCKNRFGQFDTLNKKIDWEIEGIANTAFVNSRIIDDKKLVVTSGSKPSIFEVASNKIDIAAIADINLRVHANKSLVVELPNTEQNKRYVWTSSSRLGELSTIEGESSTFEYTPDILGRETLSYSILKGEWEAARGIVNIDVYNKPPQLSDIALLTHWRNPIEFSLPLTDEDGDKIIYTFINSPQVGQLSWANENTNTLRYAPMSYKTVESIQYRGNDGRANSTVKNIDITLTNTAPQAAALSHVAERNKPITIKLKGSDPDGDIITYHVDSVEQIAGFKLDANTGEVSLTPNVNSPASITFGYSVSDSISNSTVASVTVVVNDSTTLVSDSKSSGNISPTYLVFLMLMSCVKGFVQRKNMRSVC
ncbi:Ig-like domain-containing protein [Pseudoalteromonas aurantia]|uniref:Cadherin domain-containing protein n=1 Tax=Pseudoalteromonas aurantia 208 TaxID=1314867 RepID=A0ABR9EGK8_9GAMM|nr:Ig-like domain-containing protein [Pseudoalteromonas aurantia]MBE0370138.1 hypothetical protein [Pseudoalteromonas aurantia 208]